MRYSLGHDMVFVIIALASAITLFSKHGFISSVLFAIAMGFVYFEQEIHDWWEA